MRARFRREQKEHPDRRCGDEIRRKAFERAQFQRAEQSGQGGKRAEARRRQRGDGLYVPGSARHLKMRFMTEEGAGAVE